MSCWSISIIKGQLYSLPTQVRLSQSVSYVYHHHHHLSLVFVLSVVFSLSFFPQLCIYSYHSDVFVFNCLFLTYPDLLYNVLHVSYIVLSDNNMSLNNKRRRSVSCYFLVIPLSVKTIFRKTRDILFNTSLLPNTRKRVPKCCIEPILLLGSESWTLNRSTQRSLQATETWSVIRMLRVP